MARRMTATPLRVKSEHYPEHDAPPREDADGCPDDRDFPRVRATIAVLATAMALIHATIAPL
jgi:hypothetical protein